ncbi:hypothetical protein A0H81_08402 [Grifola frondosa]|uniref:Vacuolar fusion protein MON1 n=1 Tax=Grifola frondosa TaxID=5627 RepID=A0A1C7M590_GRIFR|nr:hypothetical protein A0H81_08402 [Grifola frondosa]
MVQEGAGSSTSSSLNTDLPEGILVQSLMSRSRQLTESKALRADASNHLLATMKKNHTAMFPFSCRNIPPRQYFVLTNAGKPVFISHQQDGDSDSFTSTIGIVQALVSVFIDDGDKIRCINAGSTRITFLLRSPLYYVCVSSWGEPESVEDTISSGLSTLANIECRVSRTTKAHV